MRNNRKNGRRGSALVYATLGMVVLSGVTGLAVDWGRVQLVKTELQASADAAARYAASGVQNEINGVSAAKSNASAVVAQNRANGKAINFDEDADVEIGLWTSLNKTFAPNNNLNQANAVRVTLRCVKSRNSGVPLAFMSIFGKYAADVTATSIAMVDFTSIAGGMGNGSYQYYVPATSNPWLSGTSSGTIANNPNPANNPDYAGTAYVDSGTGNPASSYTNKKSSPITAGGITITPGSTISFDGVNGGANNMSSSTVYDGDGNTSWIASNIKGNENGMSDLKAPINAVVGIFLNANNPSSGSTPSALDFSTEASRDFTSLAPALKQPFFIGDGRTSTGEVQRIVVPTGATRLFIGTMDEYEWNNNIGGFTVTAHVSGKIIMVK